MARSDIETITVGPDFPGLNLTAEAGSTSGARVALNTRRERHSLRGLPGPGLNPVLDVKETVRGVACHTRANASPFLLVAGGSVIRSGDGMDVTARTAAGDATRPLFWNGEKVSLSGTGYVTFVQDGNRTYFIETGLGNVGGAQPPPPPRPPSHFQIGVSAIGGTSTISE